MFQNFYIFKPVN